MPANILDKYRRATEESRAERPKIETLQGEPYKAYESAATPQRRFDLRPGYDAQRLVSYGYLTDVVHAGGVIIGLSITVPLLSVEIKGRNLQELVDLLREERITSIQEHIADWHAKAEDGQPLIESMQITQPGKRGPTAPKKH